MNIFNIKKAYSDLKSKKWDKLYWAIDLHDSLIKANYNGKTNNIELNKSSLIVLKYLSNSSKHCLILFTSSFEKQTTPILELFKNNQITFNYVNENPEVPSTTLGNFKDKFYYNILIDDKAGFEMNSDWDLVWQEILKYKET